MPTLTIDGQSVEVPPGTSVLAAARRLGIQIPTLCYLEDYEPSTSCQLCMVKLRNPDRLVPSCGTLAVEGMVVESQTEELFAIRRTALELLLSDHVGDCLAPCQFACPAHMDIPLMLREITQQKLREAIVTVKETIALPAVLGRVCPKPCEKGCHRADGNGAVAVCGLKRFVADVDLASGQPYLPVCDPPSGKRVAVVGAGPTGLSAAYYLRRRGHAVTVFDDQPQPGGRLRHETTPQELPRDVLDAEIGTILALGIELRSSTQVGRDITLDELRTQFDAVLVACGTSGKKAAAAWGLPSSPHGIAADRDTYATPLPAVFAAGNAIRHKGLVVRSVADGHEAALAIDHFLRTGTPALHGKPFSVRIGRLEKDEIEELAAQSAPVPRQEIPDEPAAELASQQAARCLHCDCRSVTTCKLRHYAAQYGADPGRFRGQRKRAERLDHGQVIYEPAKCIQCGLCIQIAKRAGEPLGLTFVGRGFDVRVAVPFDHTLDEALTKVAHQCVAACPTAALSMKVESPSALPLYYPAR